MSNAAHGTPTWRAVRKVIKRLDEGDGAPREEVVRRVSNMTGHAEDSVEGVVEDMERRGEVYRVNGRLKDTNEVL